jgi:hypothetical protein
MLHCSIICFLFSGERSFENNFRLGLRMDMRSHQPIKSRQHAEVIAEHMLEMFLYNQQQLSWNKVASQK